MFTTNHSATAFVIALTVKEPALVIPMSFASHFVLDALPHFGRHPKVKPYNKLFVRIITIDSILALTLAAVAALTWSDDVWLLAAASIAATLPDMLWLLKDRYRNKPGWKQFFAFHHKIQWGERPYGMVFELIWLFFILVILFSL